MQLTSVLIPLGLRSDSFETVSLREEILSRLEETATNAVTGKDDSDSSSNSSGAHVSALILNNHSCIHSY